MGELNGIGPSGAARLLGDIRDVNRAYYRRRVAEGKTTMEALRALKRHLSDVVHRRMVLDASTCPNQPDGSGRTRGSGSAIQRGQPNPDG